MSELKARKFFEAVPTSNAGFYQPGAFVDGYLKAEADKVIAELKNLVDEFDKDFEIVDNQNERLLKILGHHKYKRCLAMAEWCNSEMGRETFACFRPRSTKEVWREEHKYWAKWRKIRFNLAKKFKEAK